LRGINRNFEESFRATYQSFRLRGAFFSPGTFVVRFGRLWALFAFFAFFASAVAFFV
jgi:hypothetical protein